MQARTKTVTFRRRTLNRKCSEGALIVRPPVGGLDADYMGPGLYCLNRPNSSLQTTLFSHIFTHALVHFNLRYITCHSSIFHPTGS